MICICLNSVLMMFRSHDSQDEIIFYIELGNYVFTIIFFIEAVLKLLGLGITQYFTNKWNVFDF
eukprot:UN27127